MLYLTGYLTTVRKDELPEPLEEGETALKIPNKEIREIFESTVKKWFEDYAKTGTILTTRIDNDTYIVVMTDGDEAILEKDRTGKDGKLKICKDKYMKVDCKIVAGKKKYRRASGTGIAAFLCPWRHSYSNYLKFRKRKK